MPDSTHATKWIRLGLVGRAHGVRGAVRLRLAPGGAKSLRPGTRLRLGGHRGEATERALVYLRGENSGAPIVRFEGVEGRAAASALTGNSIEIRASDLPPVGEDEFYFHEVLGARLETAGGEVLGKVSDVWDGGGRFYLVCDTPKGQAYFPMTRQALVCLGGGDNEAVVRARPEALIYPDEVEP